MALNGVAGERSLPVNDNADTAALRRQTAPVYRQCTEPSRVGIRHRSALLRRDQNEFRSRSGTRLQRHRNTHTAKVKLLKLLFYSIFYAFRVFTFICSMLIIFLLIYIFISLF